MSEVLSEWVGGRAPSPAAYAPPILLPGPTSRNMGEAAQPLLQKPGGESQERGLASTGPACLRPGEEDGSGRVGTGARTAQIQDGATRAGSPVSWGPATLVRQEAAASPETPSQPPSPRGCGGDCQKLRMEGGREEGKGWEQEAALSH